MVVFNKFGNQNDTIIKFRNLNLTLGSWGMRMTILQVQGTNRHEFQSLNNLTSKRIDGCNMYVSRLRYTWQILHTIIYFDPYILLFLLFIKHKLRTYNSYNKTQYVGEISYHVSILMWRSERSRERKKQTFDEKLAKAGVHTLFFMPRASVLCSGQLPRDASQSRALIACRAHSHRSAVLRAGLLRRQQAYDSISSASLMYHKVKIMHSYQQMCNK